jgi:anti-sigma factor RsiW
MNDGSALKQLDQDSVYQEALGALVDDELSPGERAALLEQIANDSQAGRLIAHYRGQNAALKALFPMHEKQRQSIFLPRRTSWLKLASFAAVWMILGLALGLGGKFGLHPAGQPEFARNADVAYAIYAPEQRHPVEVAASDKAHLINWLSKRLERPLTAPSLLEYGYALIGGRLLPGESGPAAQFMYEDKMGQRVSLYMTAASRRAETVRMLSDGKGQNTFYWVDKGMGYALSGRSPTADLKSIAMDVCGALGGNTGAWQ